MSLKFLASSIVGLALVAPMVLFAADEKADKADSKKAAAAKAEPAEGTLKGRLPANYSKIVDETQRQKIYGIQANYLAQIEALKKQLLDLEAKRDSEIRNVLTAKQQKQLDELVGDTKAKGKKAAATKDAKE